MKDRIEFDSVVTEADLFNFKIYHNYHTVGGIFQVVFGIFALVLSFISLGKTEWSYTSMIAFFGCFFIIYPPISMKMSSKRQIKSIKAFKEPMHYVVTPQTITLSQGEVSEDISWNDIYKVKFTGKNLVIYIDSVRANILTANTMGDEAYDFVDMARTKLKPFQVKVNENKLFKVVG